MRKRMAISDDHARIVLALVQHPAKPPLSAVCRWARMFFEELGLPDCSEMTLRRFLKRQMAPAPSLLRRV
ncbi:MAG: hypothetical protein AB7U59_13890 [Desulfovibrionaceae bacterium]